MRRPYTPQPPPRNTLDVDAHERLRRRRVRLAAAGYRLEGGHWVPVRAGPTSPTEVASVLNPGKFISLEEE